MSPTPVRRIAVALAEHAARITPAERAEWGRAMRAEIDHIASDGRALRWALGCVWAGYRMRSIAMNRIVIIALRCALAAMAALYALSQLPVALMVLGYKTGNLDMAAASSGAAAGDSYARFVPLMEQMTMPHLYVALAQIALYLAGAALLALGWRRAPYLLAAALGLELIGKVWMRALPAWSATFGSRDTIHDFTALAVLAAVAAAAFWIAAQRPRPLA